MKTQLVNLKGGAKLLFNRQTEVNGISVVFSFDAGAINDPKSKLGVAHFCEHALCGFPNGKMSREERESYCRNFQYYNARTSKYKIDFIVKVNDHRLEDAFDFVTESFSSIKLIPEEFNREQNIIRQEINTIQKKNSSLAYYVYNTKIIKDKHTNNINNSAAGSIESFNKITLKDLKTFIDSYLTLNNLTITIVGNTKFSKVKQLAKKYVEKRFKQSDIQGYQAQNPDIYKTAYHFEKAVEEGKALFELDYFDYRLPFSYTPYKEQFISRFVNSVVNEMLYNFYRVNENLVYGCSAFVGKCCDWFTQEISIPCGEENLQKVIDAFPNFLQSLPKDLPRDLYDKSKNKFLNAYEFDFLDLSGISDACLSNYIYERKLYSKKTKENNRKQFESVTYDMANDMYKKLFKVNPHITIISNDEKYKDYKYKDFKVTKK